MFCFRVLEKRSQIPFENNGFSTYKDCCVSVPKILNLIAVSSNVESCKSCLVVYIYYGLSY